MPWATASMLSLSSLQVLSFSAVAAAAAVQFDCVAIPVVVLVSVRWPTLLLSTKRNQSKSLSP
jgi:hypothetical protein